MSETSAQLAVAVRDLAIGKGAAATVSALSFELARASFTAMVGPNGCGKTTLFETLLGLARPKAGSAKVLGRAPAAARRDIAYVPQAGRLDFEAQFIGRDFVAAAYRGQRWGMALSPRAARRAVDAALASVGATELARHRFSALSGGQRQRLLIAQALVNRPTFVFVDEPLAQLDPAASDEIVALIAHLRHAHGIGVLFSTHDVNPVVGVAEQVLYLAGGSGRIGGIDAVVNDAVLTELYGVPMNVVREHGQVFVTRDRRRCCAPGDRANTVATKHRAAS